eukprot:352756-Chlamydomonas_euryale.AAC.4
MTSQWMVGWIKGGRTRLVRGEKLAERLEGSWWLDDRVLPSRYKAKKADGGINAVKGPRKGVTSNGSKTGCGHDG